MRSVTQSENQTAEWGCKAAPCSGVLTFSVCPWRAGNYSTGLG
ncbi:hypothetical protein ADIMK_0251 [Marinobacterium lacunae]|uniref:Uncharacterized protein n=1 Tax=Marinobacterium lacunae TaxID=1232683 RepID=A0A081G3D9_9GAMM|nr:hypothetical protein ADIMK_0251 [Marinobacterium lacunae]